MKRLIYSFLLTGLLSAGVTRANANCTPAHLTSAGTPYVIANNLVLIVAVEGYIIDNAPTFMSKVQQHASMTRAQLLADIVETFENKPDGFLSGEGIFDTSEITAAALPNYSTGQILAEEMRQARASQDTGARYLDTTIGAELATAVRCNDTARVAAILDIYLFREPGY
jgi:hypothetical protein